MSPLIFPTQPPRIELDSGQSRYTPDPGKVPAGATVTCGICRRICGETRNVNGPRGFAQAMSGSKSMHDVFCCPAYDKMWHKRIEKLLGLARETPSETLAQIYRNDADDLLSVYQSWQP